MSCSLPFPRWCWPISFVGFPSLSFVDVDELFRISSIARQVRHEMGATMQEEGTPVEYIQVLVDGRIRITGKERQEEELSPPVLLGFREVLEGAPLRETAQAIESSICLGDRGRGVSGSFVGQHRAGAGPVPATLERAFEEWTFQLDEACRPFGRKDRWP